MSVRALGRTRKLDRHVCCLVCDQRIDCATAIKADPTAADPVPKPGALMVCSHCGAVQQMRDDGGFEIAKAEDLASLPEDFRRATEIAAAEYGRTRDLVLRLLARLPPEARARIAASPPDRSLVLALAGLETAVAFRMRAGEPVACAVRLLTDAERAAARRGPLMPLSRSDD